VSTRLGRRLRVALVRRRCLERRPLLPRARRAELAAEREARDVAGLPWRHPESVNRPLRERYEVRLAELASAAWPDDEHEHEIEFYDEGGNA
jgi:hypothetical protein